MNETNNKTRLQTQLGYAGLIPFFGLTIGALIVHDADLRIMLLDAQTAYAGLIASFLGGIHWGVSLVNSDRSRRVGIIWGVMPSLLAWPLLMLPTQFALPAFTVLFVAIWLIDLRLLAGNAFLVLRTKLTVAVTISLILSFAGAVGVFE